MTQFKTIAGKKLQVGNNSHRLVEDDNYYQKEINFVKAINHDMEVNSQALAQMVNQKTLSSDQETLILSVIQWLGTPVGQCFLEKANSYQ